MKKLICLISFLLVASVTVVAKDKKKKTAEQPVKRDTTQVEKTTPGLFGVSKKEKDWFFVIPDSLLSRPILSVTRYVSTPAGAGKYGGEMVNSQTVYWEKSADGSLLLRAMMLETSSDEKDAISKSVKVSAEDPILGAFKVEKREGAASRVKVTQLFTDDNATFSLSNSAKRQYSLGQLKRDASFISSIRTYPINTEVTTTKTYAYNAPDPRAAAAGGQRPTILAAGYATGSVSIQLNTSFILLPKEPMKPRAFDARVGYFADGYTWFSDEQQSVDQRRFICRYRLEARPEDVEKQKRGELVEPIKPIVYYIDPATPKQWVPYLIAGVNDWQKAFEQAGWKNAIHAEEWPNDSTMSMEDARFCVIRYLASDIPNAYGPNVHDPRSGEILESHIGWYHNVMKLVHDWYMVQAAAIDPRARKMKFDDELMGDLIRFVSSHEVGHTLGLRHNKGSSFMTPVEKLRDKAWVEANGHTVSIMDYARFNYVAQPEDNITKAGIYPRIGIYDKWAIEYGYKPTYFNTLKEDKLFWNKEIIARLNAEPRLWFGGEGYDNDPRAQSEDLGDNSAKASEYGIKNLQRVIKALPEWTKEEGDMNENLQRMYEAVVSQYQRYLGHVASNIGGRYITYKSVEQAGDVYDAVPKERQKEALSFLNKHVFKKAEWLVSEPYMFRFTDRPENYLYTAIDAVVSRRALLSLAGLNRLDQFAQKSAANYKPEEYLADLTAYIFEELNNGKAVDSYRRHLQRRFVKEAIAIVTDKANDNQETRFLIVAELKKIGDKAKRSVSANAVTKAHWSDLAQQIEAAFSTGK